MEFEQRSKVRSLSKPSIGHWEIVLGTIIVGLSERHDRPCHVCCGIRETKFLVEFPRWIDRFITVGRPEAGAELI
jgi:hypothetical protein